MTFQYFIYTKHIADDYGDVWVNPEGTPAYATSADMAKCFALRLSESHPDHVYVVLQYADGLPNGSVGQAFNGAWDNHDKDVDMLIPVSVARVSEDLKEFQLNHGK